MAEPATPQLSAETLTGDIRDFMLLWIRSMQKPFEAMSESQQRDVIEAVEASARELVGGVISIVSAGGFERAFVKLGQFTVKEGIEAKLVTARTERNLLNFNDFAGKSAMLIFADPQEFDGQRAPARVYRQQRDIEEEIADRKAAEAKTPTQAPTVQAPPDKPKKERKKAEKPPVKTTDVDTLKDFKKPSAVIDGDGIVKRVDTSPGAFGTNRELIDPDTGEVLDASKSPPRDLGDPPRLNENETVDPITGEIVEIKPAATLDDLFTKSHEEEPDAVLVEEAPAGDAEVTWSKNPTNPAQQPQPEMPELPATLKRVKNPAKPGTIDKNDPGEPETVTVNDSAPVKNKRATEKEPEVDDDDKDPFA